MEAIGTICLVFGGIFLIMTIINYILMKKEVTDPNCPEDVNGVAYNKKWGKIYLIIYSTIVLFGAVILLLT